MCLTEDDYKSLILPADRDVIEQSDETTRTRAEEWAVEQMSSYLRNRFDVEQVFSGVTVIEEGEGGIDDHRNKSVVMFCIDITLYHLHASIPGRYVPEIRIKRYDDAIAWLKDVASGKISPGLPIYTDPSTGTENSPIVWGSETRTNTSW